MSYMYIYIISYIPFLIIHYSYGLRVIWVCELLYIIHQPRFSSNKNPGCPSNNYPQSIQPDELETKEPMVITTLPQSNKAELSAQKVLEVIVDQGFIPSTSG